MERVLYVLPHQTKLAPNEQTTGEPVKMIPDVYDEVSSILLGYTSKKGARRGAAALRLGSSSPADFKSKKVVRSCIFADPHAPREPTDYLKVKIPYENLNCLSPDSSVATFSRVYGTRTSSAEALCLNRKLRGPGWIRLKNAVPSQVKVSHAKFTLTVPSPDDLLVPIEFSTNDPPPLSALCVSTKTVLNSRTEAHEVVMISGVFGRWPRYKGFCLGSTPGWHEPSIRFF
ncbi:DNA polymerase alpha catalytic subunit [Gracilaria domingensis]|nr:DNA polymerase alpha catalytic subunit [Gracilaria domingensis]